MEIMITNENFETEVINSDKPVLVDFFATWCGPCKMIAPIIEEIANEYADKVKVCKIDTDVAPQLAIRYGVSRIPTILVFKNGEVVSRAEGLRSKEQLIEMI
jgi:thioredoxin 1